MYGFDKERKSFEKTPDTLTVDGRIQNEDKRPPLVLNIFDQLRSTGVQAGRCAECGSAGCFQGCGPEQPGCPFERAIPDIHDDLAKAHQVEQSALTLLTKLSPSTVERLKAETQAENQAAGFSQTNARFPKKLFDALKEFNHAAGEKAQNVFDHHMKQAWKLSKSKGPMGDIYGRICPESLCEATCTTKFSGHEAVTIKKNEAGLWDYAWASGWMDKMDIAQEREESIVVVGTGFAAYAATEKLREAGYKVTMLEKNKAPGEPGHNQILPYKVGQERFNRYYTRLQNNGVEIITNMPVGNEGVTLRQIKERFNPRAIVLASGAIVSKDGKLGGDAKDAVVSAGDFLADQQRINRENLSSAEIPANLNAKDKVVAVIGTGDTAVDAARTAIVQGAKEVIFIARADKIRAEGQDRAAYELMKERAEKSGVKFTIQQFMEPRDVLKGEQGNGFVVRGINRAPERTVPLVNLKADMVISAIGTETGQLKETFGVANLPVSNSGSLVVVPVPERIATKTPMLDVGAGYAGKLDGVDIFGAGQVIREGASLAAICGRDGFDAAEWVRQSIEQPEAFAAEVKEISGHAPLELHYAHS